MSQNSLDTERPRLPDYEDAPASRDYAIAYCRDIAGILLSDSGLAAACDEILARLGISHNFALLAVESLDEDYPSLSEEFKED